MSAAVSLASHFDICQSHRGALEDSETIALDYAWPIAQ
jgi:hypothetical protein